VPLIATRVSLTNRRGFSAPVFFSRTADGTTRDRSDLDASGNA
jgi:hypothetical protein